MAIRTLSPKDTSLSVPLMHITYTCGRLQAHPLGAPYVPTFVALRQKCVVLAEQERSLREAVFNAQALVDHADDLLDAFIDKVTKALELLTGDVRNHPLFTHFFGSKRPSEFKRPVLGEKLTTLRTDWLPSFEDSPHDALLALAPELEQLVTQGTSAASAKTEAEAALERFRDIGARFAFFQELNAARKELYGKLAKLPHEQMNLPKRFAERFFLHDPKRKEDAPTIDSVEATIKDLVREMDAQNALLATLRKREEEARNAKVTLAARKAALAELEKQEAKLAAETAALREEIAAQSKAPRKSRGRARK